MKTCKTCGADLPLTEFHKDRNSSDGYVHSCRACVNRRAREHHRANREDRNRKRRAEYYMKNYGLTPEEYDRGWQEQGNCLICQTKLKGGIQTHLDHCHTTGRHRGYLCTNCNRGLGHFQDSKEILLKAVEYLHET